VAFWRYVKAKRIMEGLYVCAIEWVVRAWDRNGDGGGLDAWLWEVLWADTGLLGTPAISIGSGLLFR
jgi:hypothetical protein